jgi:YesN/AraC family two-component response regulator
MIQSFYNSGINDHITKPFSKSELLGAIEKNIKTAFSEPQKDKAPKTLQNKLEEIFDDFGEDFFFSFIADSLDEIDRLNQILNTLHEEKSYETMHQFAHDICAVSGNIGMKSTYHAAKIIENNSLKSDYDQLAEQIKGLNQTINKEKELVKAIVNSLKEQI